MRLAAALLLFASPLIVFAATPANGAVKTQPFYRQRNLKVPAAVPHDSVVVNAASFLAGVSPGGLATVFGQNLTDVANIVVAGTNPFPTQLANVQVFVNNIPAPLFSIAYSGGQDQISFQVPYETPVGPGAALIQVFDYGNDVLDIRTDSFTEDPGIFTYQGSYAVAERGADGSLIGPNNPAYPGDVVVLYTTGLGPLSLNLVDGVGAPSNPLAYTLDPYQVVVDGEPCKILFSGLAPGYVGLYQINLVLPSDLPNGNLDIQILSQYANSGIAKLPVQY